MKRMVAMGCLVIGLGMFLLPGGSAAVDPAQVQQLRSMKRCLNCDLHKVDLSGTNLSEVDLSGTDLSEADLHEVNLSRANLSKATLREANLRGAILTGANLDRVTWTDGGKCKDGSVGQCNK